MSLDHQRYDANNSEEVDNEKQLKRNKMISFLLLVASIMLVVAIVLISVRASRVPNRRNDLNSVGQKQSNTPTSPPSVIPSVTPSYEADIAINFFLQENIVPGTEEKVLFLVPGTPQWKAKRWMTREDTLSWNEAHQFKSTKKLIQRYVLAVIYFSISKGGNIDVDWLHMDECNSVSVSCDDDGFLRTLEISKYRVVEVF
mmetsp:Transcript_5344/g.10192  ORF Transcript_5344/g.10192 Transcript_5344/m.10192 type:complete len:200 (+) Transcript_5344:2798-3397(+)